MRKPQHAIVIHSPHSGRSEFLSQALTLLEQAGVQVAGVLSIAELNTLPPQGPVWREQGMLLAIAAGGDGVVGGVITHLAASGLPLGILPLGTANDVARSLRIPQNLPQAVEVIAQGHTRPIDVGVAWPLAQASQQEQAPAPTASSEQACFAHALTVGLNVEFARIATDVATRQRFGHLAYPVAVLQAVGTHEVLDVELHFDGLFFPSAPTETNANIARSHRGRHDTVLSCHPGHGCQYPFLRWSMADSRSRGELQRSPARHRGDRGERDRRA